MGACVRVKPFSPVLLLYRRGRQGLGIKRDTDIVVRWQFLHVLFGRLRSLRAGGLVRGVVWLIIGHVGWVKEFCIMIAYGYLQDTPCFYMICF